MKIYLIKICPIPKAIFGIQKDTFKQFLIKMCNKKFNAFQFIFHSYQIEGGSLYVIPTRPKEELTRKQIFNMINFVKTIFL